MEEVWKIIEGFPSYEVSNTGSVRVVGGKSLKPFISCWGYKRLTLTLAKKYYKHSLHRLVAIAFIPNPDNKPCVNHKDGDKLNCHVDNLEWSTIKENTQHAFSTGLASASKGQDKGNAKLTDADVLVIREKASNGKRGIMTILANEYNVGIPMISLIINRKNWTHI